MKIEEVYSTYGDILHSQMENTAIIFTTDHGFYFGGYDIFGKMVFDNNVSQRLQEPRLELKL